MQQTGASGSQQRSGPKMSDAAFQQIDADGDDRISREEGSSNEYVNRTFDGIDADSSGYIEKQEIKGDGASQ